MIFRKLFFSLLICIGCIISVKAQIAPSAGINVEASPLNPQTGQYNYFNGD